MHMLQKVMDQGRKEVLDKDTDKGRTLEADG